MAAKSRGTELLERVGLKERDPKEQLREWTREIRKEQRGLDRELRGIEREELKIQREIKMLAKKGEKDAIYPLARALLRSRATKEQIHVAKAHMNSIMLEMRHQTAMLRMAKVMQSSTKVMASMNHLKRVRELQGSMAKMAYEMEKAGLIEEMMEDAMEGAFGVENEDAEVEAQVDAVISELTSNLFEDVPSVPTSLPAEDLAESGRLLFQESLSAEGLNEDDELDRRLAALHAS